MPEFKDIADEIKKTGKAKRLTVRHLIQSTGKERRGKYVIRSLNNKLRHAGLKTEPDFTLVHIDSTILLKPTDPKDKPVTAARKRARLNLVTISDELDARTTAAEEIEREVVLTVGQLPSADRKPTFITKDETIEKAITLLLQEGVDHLVVSQNQRQADGVVTWESIGRTRATRNACTNVRDCMSPQPWTVRFDKPLYDAVREISRRRIVLVTASNGMICGSVTPSDIADQFVALSEPFLFLEQIENHLRALVRTARLGPDGLRELVDPRDEARRTRLKSVDDLTFGEILRAFESPEIWGKIGLPLDRKSVLERLTRINRIRNHVMHFHPDGISDEEREILRRTREMLQSI